MTAGAYTEVRRLPNSRRTSPVATITFDRRGSVRPERSVRRRPGGIPCTLRTWHIAGSQDTTALVLTWLATQVAAPLRIVWMGGPGAPRLWSPPCRDSTNATDPVAASTTAETRTPAIRYRRPTDP